ncbi:LolA family protein [Limisphaera sp. 4302-co]|uniref:LolA family protein n=1 Tax=Limisphaera sp. 4302-co TaxID=3400417 RepID=UPI003C1EE298
MKRMIVRVGFLRTLVFGLACAALPGLGIAHAQVPAASSTSFDAALMRLFDAHKTFTAEAELRVTDSRNQDKVVLPMQFAAREGRFRTEVDLSRMKGSQARPDQMATVKRMGMDRIVSITRTDTGAMHVLFPSARAAVNLAMSAEDRAALNQPPAIERKVLGQETVDGHPCRKETVTLTTSGGKKTEVTVWFATDLKEFPLQIQTTETGDTVTFRYRNVRFQEPDARLFEPPADYTAYSSMEAFTADLMRKLMKEASQQ